MPYVTGAVAVIRALIDLAKYIKEFRREQKVAQALKLREDHALAADDLTKAVTDEEILDAQKRLTRKH